MFNNIGRKLKIFAKFVAIAGTLASILIGIAGIVTSGSDLETINGWMLLISGLFSSVAAALILYGFGELVETNQRMYKLMLRKANNAALQTPIEDDTWVCEECGNINKNTNASCAKCGAAWEQAGFKPIG